LNVGNKWLHIHENALVLCVESKYKMCGFYTDIESNISLPVLLFEIYCFNYWQCSGYYQFQIRWLNLSGEGDFTWSFRTKILHGGRN